jgi:hypothetical protein
MNEAAHKRDVLPAREVPELDVKAELYGRSAAHALNLAGMPTLACRAFVVGRFIRCLTRFKSPKDKNVTQAVLNVSQFACDIGQPARHSEFVVYGSGLGALTLRYSRKDDMIVSPNCKWAWFPGSDGMVSGWVSHMMINLTAIATRRWKDASHVGSRLAKDLEDTYRQEREDDEDGEKMLW